MDDKEFISLYLENLWSAVVNTNLVSLTQATDALYEAWKAGKPVLFCGNGGSGASCSHIVNDLQKGCRLKAICLSDCTPVLTAWANDHEWESVFMRQVYLWREPGGVLVAISGSGNSENVINAVDAAAVGGMKTIGLTGFGGGQLRGMVDFSLHVPTESMQQAEDIHMTLLHLLFLLLGRRIQANA
jgi:D-sedoheptulose 7-phosphate isomerase